MNINSNTDYFDNMAVAVVSISVNISTNLQYEYHEDLFDEAPYSLLRSQRVLTIESGLQFSGLR